MSPKSVYSAFTAGEVSEEFFARTDLARFNYGAAKAENFFVDYRGGLISRHGYEYVFPCPYDEGQPRFFRFNGSEVDLLLVFSNNRMRVVKNGGYVLEASKPITAATNANPCVITSAAHGYSVNDLIYVSGILGMPELNNRYFRIAATTTDTITLDSPDGEAINSSAFGTYVSDGTVARVYALTVPYDTASLQVLRMEQRLNDVYLTSKLLPPRKITYTSDTSWAISLVTFIAPNRPSGLAATASAAGTSGGAYCVTAVVNGVETPPSATILMLISSNSATETVTLKWNSVPGAEYYNVYRTSWSSVAAELTRGYTKGYIGQTTTPQFVDVRIDPDFTKVPPRPYTPFTAGAISGIEVTNRGTGYLRSNTVSISGAPGTGFAGDLVVNNVGDVLSVSILDPGSGYVSPTATITTGTGSGAVLVVTANPGTGNYPDIYRTFQSRGIWASTVNNPITIWGSRPGAPENLSYSDVLRADDGYIYSLDVNSVKPIKHVTAIRSGLLLFTEAGVVQLLPSSGKVITPLNAAAEDQAFLPVSDVDPLRIGLDVLFTEEDGDAVQAMQYTEYTETFQLQDIAVLSSHLITSGRRPRKMVYWSSPHKLIYILREDGQLALCTYDRSQEIFGWTEQVTKGYYRDIEIVRETDGETPYVLVERYVNGQWRYFGERAKTRQIARDEDAFCVDCGLSTELVTGLVSINFSGFSGEVTCTKSGGGFNFDSSWLGRVIYAGEGKFEITHINSVTQVTGTFLRNLEQSVPYSAPIPYIFPPLTWAYSTPTSEISNLWHLEGERVSVLADGDAYDNVLVSGGKISLEFPATKVVVGLKYYCDLKTLPITNNQVMIEGEDKRVMGLHFRRLRSRGLFIGPDFNTLREVKERGDIPWGQSLGLSSEVEEISLDAGFDYNSQICFRQPWPLPCTILGLVFDLEVSE